MNVLTYYNYNLLRSTGIDTCTTCVHVLYIHVKHPKKENIYNFKIFKFQIYSMNLFQEKIRRARVRC